MKRHEEIQGEVITPRKGIANVFGEFHNKLYDEDQHDETEMESDGDEIENDGKELIEIPEITQQMNYRKQSKDSRMAKQRKARESERKT